jgi:hypothetical protein
MYCDACVTPPSPSLRLVHVVQMDVFQSHSLESGTCDVLDSTRHPDWQVRQHLQVPSIVKK